MISADNRILNIWEKATKVERYDSNVYRKDLAGAWIKKDDYAKESTFGWEIAHVLPPSKGGTDALLNMIPMHWQNNRMKHDDFHTFRTTITSDDNKNLSKEQIFYIDDILAAQFKPECDLSKIENGKIEQNNKCFKSINMDNTSNVNLLKLEVKFDKLIEIQEKQLRVTEQIFEKLKDIYDEIPDDMFIINKVELTNSWLEDIFNELKEK